MAMTQPNLLFVFGDQWRAQALGYAGDPNACTPRIDRFAAESANFINATAGTPVCCPYRATLMTGQEPLTHGVMVNDVGIISDAVPLAECFNRAGYRTGYIGKWHIDGHGRQAYVPPERRLGFQYWRGFECTHDYNRSFYYADTPELLLWEGYDAEAQTACAIDYLRERETDQPFALFLSWGPPHAPYHTAPERFRAKYRAEDVVLRSNVPAECADVAREELAGYYAHIEALDEYFGRLLDELDALGLRENTIVVFTSDHGDMIRCHGETKKQKPWEESVRVPFLVRGPGIAAGEIAPVLDSVDIMPTLLGMCGVGIPPTVQGTDASPLLRGQAVPELDGALLACHFPFHQWHTSQGGREYRGVRTERYTYCRDLAGPWLLYDNQTDPYQMTNLVNRRELATLQAELDALLDRKLARVGDGFLPGIEYVKRRGVKLNERGDVPTYPDHGPTE
jgi:arylsulfatase A-like enzyme